MKLKDLHEASGAINIRDWMKKHCDKFDDELLDIKDGEVHYDGDVKLKNISRIEVPFAKVAGTFEINGSSSSITSLENSPRVVEGDFRIINQPITSLEHSPKFIKGRLVAFNCHLTSVSHLSETMILSNYIYLADNPQIRSLKNIHKEIFHFTDNGTIDLSGSNIESNILGLILITNLKHVLLSSRPHPKLEHAYEIVEKYFGQGRKGVIAAQRELIDNDLDEFAEL